MQLEARTRPGVQGHKSWHTGRSETGITARLHVKDKLSDEIFLIDTGADISVIPKRRKWWGDPAQFKLYAVSGSTIDVYGVARLHNWSRPAYPLPPLIWSKDQEIDRRQPIHTRTCIRQSSAVSSHLVFGSGS